jgi:hypothetical protein
MPLPLTIGAGAFFVWSFKMTTSVEELCLQGFGSRVQSTFKLPTPPLMVATSAHVVHAQLSQEANKGSKPLAYPLFFFRVSGFSEAQQSPYNPIALAYEPVSTATDEDTQGRLSLLPINMDIECSYLDNDHGRVLNLAARWCKAGVSGALTFMVRVDGAPLAVVVRPAISVSFNTKDINPDGVNHYEVNLTATMSAYVSGPFDESLYRIALSKEMAFAMESLRSMPVQPALNRNFAYTEAAIENDGLPRASRPLFDLTIKD